MLENVTIWSCCWSDGRDRIERHLEVLRYCQIRFKEAQFLLFCSEPLPPQEFQVVQIPRLNGMSQWNYFVNYEVPRHINTEFCMSVHEDGFPICPELWNERFLQYDYIGAPWWDRVVGNGGFNIESKRLLQLKTIIPPRGSDLVASDTWVCRTHRKWLETRGVRFAPLAVAVRFSTEHWGKDYYSFGFHGPEHVSTKYNCAWEILRETLNENRSPVFANSRAS